MGAARVNTAVWVGTAACSFSGSGVAETELLGAGSVIGTCSGSNVLGSMTKHCALVYTRVGSKVITSGTCNITIVSATGAATGSGTERGSFSFMPTNVNPTTSYVLAGSNTVAH